VLNLCGTRSGGELGAVSGKTLQALGSQHGRSAQPLVSADVDSDLWALAEHLVAAAEDAAAFELPEKVRCSLIEITVDLMALLTCWPGGIAPADQLGYLRARRARMEGHAPWLYALPASARRLLLGTERHPSLLTFVVGTRRPSDAQRRAWRRAMGALVSHLEPVRHPGAERPDALDRADVPVVDGRLSAPPQHPLVYESPRPPALRGPPLAGPSGHCGTSRLRDSGHLAPSDTTGSPDNRSAMAAATAVGPVLPDLRTTSGRGQRLAKRSAAQLVCEPVGVPVVSRHVARPERAPDITARAAYTDPDHPPGQLKRHSPVRALRSSSRAPPSFRRCRRRACAEVRLSR
jgi:hypothetical protein